jgi:hypothetical protein
MDLRVREESAKARQPDEAHGAGGVLRRLAIRDPSAPGEGQLLQQPSAQGDREELEEREQEVRLDRKVEVRGLHEVAPSDALYLPRHRLLPGVVSHVLDHGVREDDVELAVRERVHAAGVARQGPHVRVPGRRGREVQDRDAGGRGVDEVHPLPEVLRAADVEDRDRTGQAGDAAQEEREAARSQSPGDRVPAVRVPEPV